MAKRYLHLDLPHPTTAELIRHAFDVLRGEMEIPLEFPPAVMAEVAQVMARVTDPHMDWTGYTDKYLDLEFITIDPEESMDLDQAVHIARSANGFTVHYAIADVAAFVAPGGAIDAEAHSRGMTFYAPEGRTPLHPPELSEGAASLLPDQIRPAAVWVTELDNSGQVVRAHVERGLVKSRDRMSYVAGQQVIDSYTAHQASHGASATTSAPQVTQENREAILTAAGVDPEFCAQGFETIILLSQVGPLREKIEQERGGVSLNVPEQEVAAKDDGSFELEFRSVVPIENWNAQISLLTGIVAADMMLKAGVGFVRTLPQADPRDLARLRRAAEALNLEWQNDVGYAAFIKTLNGKSPRHAAFLFEATTLFRGAGYLAFDAQRLGPVPGEDKTKHYAIGANYAHVTAPLRRLADRYAAEICLALCADQPVPDWVSQTLEELPSQMATASRRAGAFSRAGVDIVEIALLAPLVGQDFSAVVVELDSKDPSRGEIMIADPAVRAHVRSDKALPLAKRITVKLLEADLTKRKIRFQQV